MLLTVATVMSACVATAVTVITLWVKIEHRMTKVETKLDLVLASMEKWGMMPGKFPVAK